MVVCGGVSGGCVARLVVTNISATGDGMAITEGVAAVTNKTGAIETCPSCRNNAPASAWCCEHRGACWGICCRSCCRHGAVLRWGSQRFVEHEAPHCASANDRLTVIRTRPMINPRSMPLFTLAYWPALKNYGGSLASQISARHLFRLGFAQNAQDRGRDILQRTRGA